MAKKEDNVKSIKTKEVKPRKERKEREVLKPIKINKEWFITSDPFNWILSQVRGEREMHTSYHTTLESLCKSYVNHATKQVEKGDLAEVLENIQKCNKDIERIVAENIKPLVEEAVRKARKYE